MYNVAVLMSTYNGEKYISDQIKSILNQSSVNITIFIRDDGSNDDTIEKIYSYQTQHCNIHLLQGNNIGVGNSFMQLLYDVSDNYDYYAFSDQDDIWSQNKLIEAIKLLKGTNKRLYISNQRNVDKNLKYIGMRYSSNPSFTPIDILSSNKAAGCTMVFDNSFKRLLSDIHRRPTCELLHVRIHDVWVAMVGSLTNSIVYDSNSYINYRQHENNVVGGLEPTFGKVIKCKFKKFKDKEYRNGRSKLAIEIKRCYPEYIDQDSVIYRCATYKQSIFTRFGLIMDYRYFNKYNNIFTFIFYIMLGLF